MRSIAAEEFCSWKKKEHLSSAQVDLVGASVFGVDDTCRDDEHLVTESSHYLKQCIIEAIIATSTAKACFTRGKRLPA